MKFDSGKNIWFTSDTHYMHKNICKGVTRWDITTERGLNAVRDFETLEDMNEALVKGINDNVKENDWLFHIGDWSFGGFEMVEEFRSKINCKNIVLILGNHDAHIKRNRGNVQSLFTKVSRMEDIEIQDQKMILCHFPILSWEDMRKGSYMIHGHVHSKGEKVFGEGRRMDVGVCGSPEFRPYHFDEVISLLASRTNVEPE